MQPNLKGILHGIVSVVGNGAIFAFLPDEYRIWVLLAFNIVQVVLAFIDPSYAVNLIKMGKMDQLGNRIDR